MHMNISLAMVQMQELQESNLQLRLQLTRIEAASAKAFQELEVFQQHCDEASRQNEALLAELQRLQQQKQQRCSSSMPASSHRYKHRQTSATWPAFHVWEGSGFNSQEIGTATHRVAECPMPSFACMTC